MKNVALITGASSGIGKELAKIHAERGGDLVLVARSTDKLRELKRQLEEGHGVKVLILVKDLTQTDAPQEIYQRLKEDSIEVDFLINNAGFGGVGKFHERSWETDLSMINLNIVALTALTRLFLSDFVARDRGRVLNVSSTASLMAGPLQAVYFATKAYVTSFSNALAEEMRGAKVSVSALLPGATNTEFGAVSGMDKTPLFKSPASARKVALDGYEGMLKGKLDIISGVSLWQRVQLALLPLAPKFLVLRETRRLQETNS